MKYISSIAHIGKQYGICKIVPPSKKWLNGKQFEDRVRFNRFFFETKLQNVHQLQKRNSKTALFIRSLNDYLSKNKKERIEELPLVDGQRLNLRKLFEIVKEKGGYHQVTDWAEIGEKLFHLRSEDIGISLIFHYKKLLLDYELNLDSDVEDDATPEFCYGDGSFLFFHTTNNSNLLKLGGAWSLEQFKQQAKAFEKSWFGSKKASVAEKERVYWSVVENGEEPVQVNYGSDLDVKDHQSGFETTNLETASGWNLNLFATWPGSVLSRLENPILGVTIPMLYIGMLFSTFCWHTEDNYLYSINYNHTGAAKRWYGIPADSYELFERIMQRTVPEVFSADPMVLFRLVTMLSPRILVENNVPCYTAAQNAGEIMLTFPRSYHAGFNTGVHSNIFFPVFSMNQLIYLLFVSLMLLKAATLPSRIFSQWEEIVQRDIEFMEDLLSFL